MNKEAAIVNDHPTSFLFRVAKLFGFEPPIFQVLETNRLGATVNLLFKQASHKGQHSHNLIT